MNKRNYKRKYFKTNDKYLKFINKNKNKITVVCVYITANSIVLVYNKSK